MSNAADLSVPFCPACKSKFSHDRAASRCKVCGLPDEVANLGGHYVERWKRDNHVGRLLREKRRAEQERSTSVSAKKKRNKHGRKGVK